MDGIIGMTTLCAYIKRRTRNKKKAEDNLYRKEYIEIPSQQVFHINHGSSDTEVSQQLHGIMSRKTCGRDIQYNTCFV